MRLLDRYLLRELLIPLGFCLSGFLILWIAADVFNELGEYERHNLLFRDVAEYYLVKLPEFIVLVLPIALLLALLYTLTNHARHNELTAIRAAGISLWRICIPYFAVGLLFSLVLFALNEKLVPSSAERAEEILHRREAKTGDVVDKDVQRSFGFPNGRDHRTWFAEAYNFRTQVMTGPTVDWNLPDGSRRQLIAKRGEYVDGVWTFYDAQEYRAEGGGSYLKPYVQTNVLAAPEFSETPGEFRREVRISGLLARQTVHSAEISIAHILDFLDLHPDLSPGNRAWLNTQLQGRLAAPWTCLVVVLIAIPFGAASGRRNIFVGVASSIVICFIYFILLQVGLALGSGGRVPAWLAAWLPNGTFGIAGLWMTLRVR